VPGGQFLSAGFHIGGAEPYVVPDVVQLLWDGQLAQAAVAAAAGPWTDVYGLYRSLLRLLMSCDREDLAVRKHGRSICC
jgi:hypothetical protein